MNVVPCKSAFSQHLQLFKEKSCVSATDNDYTTLLRSNWSVFTETLNTTYINKVHWQHIVHRAILKNEYTPRGHFYCQTIL